jgi:hypothetical protein
MSMVGKQLDNICAFDSSSTTDRVVINYERIIEPPTKVSTDRWSYVGDIFISCLGTNFYLDMWNFKMMDANRQLIVTHVKTPFVDMLQGGASGQKEWLMHLHSKTNELKVLFTQRNRAFRIIKSTFPITGVKGSLYTRDFDFVDTLDYIKTI